MGAGRLREKLFNAWTEVLANPGRAALQSLGVMLGVASVLGGFSISDSQRRRAEELFVRMGGLDKLNVQPRAAMKDGRPGALQTANRGLARADAEDGEAADASDAIQGISLQRHVRARIRSAATDQERRVTGIGGDYLAIEGYEIAAGRPFSAAELADGAPVALLGSEAARTWFPAGDGLGQTIRIGDARVTVVGLLEERVFRFRENGNNIFRWRNRIVAVPASFVARRMNGDRWDRVDRVTFKLPKLDDVAVFSKELEGVLLANHRLQRDWRLDDVAARMEKERSQGQVYNLIFLLSGILALVGGGMVNVNIQLASLKERVREVGIRMALGASGGEIFREMMVEAVLLTGVGAAGGLLLGIGFSKGITSFLGVPLYMTPISFAWAASLALLAGVLFALYPAWKASRLSPMEALRYE